MKIVNVINSAGRGGAELMLVRLLRQLKENNDCQPIVICLSGDGQMVRALITADIKTYFPEKSHKLWPLRIVYLIRTLRQIRPDLIQSWMYAADFDCILATRFGGLRKIPVVWNIRSSEPGDGILRKLRAALLGILSYIYPKSIITCGNTAKISHLRYFYNKSIMTVIHNGYKFPDQSDSKDPSIQRNPSYINPYAIGCLARFDTAKDHPTLFKAIELLSKRSKKPIRLLLAGRGITADNVALTQLLHSTGIFPITSLLGELESVDDFFREIDLLCLSSSSEGFPNVIVEAMEALVPVVATRVGEVEHIINGNGFLAEPGDAMSISNAISKAIDLDDAEKLEMTYQGRQWVRENFDIVKISSNYITHYRRLLSN
jgi:glycosyltransferase involved in cell wall biosynthesis